MIYKVETSLKCAGVCGREQGGQGERRKTQTRMAEIGWGGGRNGPGQGDQVKIAQVQVHEPLPHALRLCRLRLDFGPQGQVECEKVPLPGCGSEIRDLGGIWWISLKSQGSGVRPLGRGSSSDSAASIRAAPTQGAFRSVPPPHAGCKSTEPASYGCLLVKHSARLLAHVSTYAMLPHSINTQRAVWPHSVLPSFWRTQLC